MADVRPTTRDSIRLSEVMAAWSVAIDVGMVMPMEFGLRVWSRAVRLAQRLRRTPRSPSTSATSGRSGSAWARVTSPTAEHCSRTCSG
jgi:hypothetical protein